ncbi:hypothetical protein ETAA8_64160 [Anatilimnocola aggregata]|uniref:Uncharacterized protein n=1 Tax=Anatilimnocola aggregata TaxID=2528021 RepID=A0A517YM16_9BACT|nr:hypothetical protein [Anatilimnocola aggregata]QDU31263.1 hypothetical protein ETAA8_64160 [Anatilimnocola aggregata]
MIIWTGWGFLVAIITFGTCLIAQYVVDAKLGAGYYSAHPWVVGLALVIGGIASSLVGFMLKARGDRQVIDSITGEEFTIDNSHHSFFFVPMHWAGLAVAAIGIGTAIFDLARMKTG